MSRYLRYLGVLPPPHPPTCSQAADTCGCVSAPLAPSAHPCAPHGDGEDGKIPASPHDANLPAAPAGLDEESSRVTAVNAAIPGHRLVAQADGANQKSRYSYPTRPSQVR